MSNPAAFPGNSPVNVGAIFAPASSTPSKAQAAVIEQPLIDQVQTLIEEKGGIEVKDQKFLALIQEHGKPEDLAEMKAIKEQYPELLDKMNDPGWMVLKKQPGADLHQMEACRRRMVNLVGKISIDMIGGAEKGKHFDFGTPGANSDIDTNFQKEPHVTHREESIEWAAFPLVWHAMFAGFPDDMADVCNYTDHPGVALKTESKLQLPESKAAFADLESGMAALQTYRGLKDNPQAVEERKTQLRKQYTDLGDQERGDIANKHLVNAEQYERRTAIEVLKKLAEISPDHQPEVQEVISRGDPKEIDTLFNKLKEESPKKLKEATVLFKGPVIFKMGIAMDAAKSEIAKILQSGVVTPEANQKAIEQLEVKLATLGALRNTLYDESYLSQGAFNVVCLRTGGQMYQQRMEKFSAPLKQAFYSQNASSNQVVVSVQHKEEELIPTTPQESIGSILENFSMFSTHYEHDLHAGDTHYQALVNRSKYLLRVMDSNEALVIQMRSSKKITRNENDGVMAGVREVRETIQDLEKLKRKRVLPLDFGIEKILDELVPGRTPEQTVQYTKDLKVALAQLKKATKTTHRDMITPEDALSMVLVNFTSSLNAGPVTKKALVVMASLAGLSLEKPETVELLKQIHEDENRLNSGEEQEEKQLDEGFGQIFSGIYSALSSAYSKVYSSVFPETTTEEPPSKILADLFKEATESVKTKRGLTDTASIERLIENVSGLSIAVETLAYRSGAAQKPKASVDGSINTESPIIKLFNECN